MKLFNLKIKKLLFIIKKTNGKNNTGKFVIQNRSGGNKNFCRYIDYKRYFYLPGLILKQENFKKHSATIALILYKNGIMSYIISEQTLYNGFILNNANILNKNIFLISKGANLLIKNSFMGSIIYNIEIKQGYGAQFSRAGGAFSQILNIFNIKKQSYILIRLKSKKEYLIKNNCNCCLGIVSSTNINTYKSFYKAGQTRNLGKKPHVRGVAMNPVDHPHGGNTSGGRCSISKYFILAKGYKTKKKKNFFYNFLKK